MIESKDFEELFALLNAHDVRYLVVGGYAVAVYARPRFTDDLDIFVSRKAEDIVLGFEQEGGRSPEGYGGPENPSII